jgi:exodeoxyribonuclease-3
MILWSWNVNGLRAAMGKGFEDVLRAEAPDVLCLQETKLPEEQIPKTLRNPEGYHAFWHHAQRKGYSGVAIFSKTEPVAVSAALTRSALTPRARAAGRLRRIRAVRRLFSQRAEGR